MKCTWRKKSEHFDGFEIFGHNGRVSLIFQLCDCGLDVVVSAAAVYGRSVCWLGAVFCLVAVKLSHAWPSSWCSGGRDCSSALLKLKIVRELYKIGKNAASKRSHRRLCCGGSFTRNAGRFPVSTIHAKGHIVTLTGIRKDPDIYGQNAP